MKGWTSSLRLFYTVNLNTKRLLLLTANRLYYLRRLSTQRQLYQLSSVVTKWWSKYQPLFSGEFSWPILHEASICPTERRYNHCKHIQEMLPNHIQFPGCEWHPFSSLQGKGAAVPCCVFGACTSLVTTVAQMIPHCSCSTAQPSPSLPVFK